MTIADFWRLALGASAVLLTLSGCGRDADEKALDARPVRTVTIEKSALGESVELTGFIQAQNEKALSFRIGGRMTERLAGVGDAIKADQLVARLDPQNEQNALRSAQARLVAGQGRLREARNNFAREQSLLARRYTTKVRFDQAQTAVETAQSDIVDATAQLKIAQDRVSYTELKSDRPGTIIARGAEAGEVVQAGQMIFRIAWEGPWDAVFDVPARLLREAPRDTNVALALTDEPSVTALGRVRLIDPQADLSTRTFRVRVSILSPPPAMRLGATVSGRMRFDPSAAISIPATALTESDGRPSVWIVDPSTKEVSLRNIKVLRFSAESVVVAQGLAAGDIVVTAGVQALHPGQRVRLLDARQ
jgi:RND family efflux transporter MFP subunit